MIGQLHRILRIAWIILLANQALGQNIDKSINSEALSSALVGVSVRSMNDGQEMYSYNGNKNFIPASSIKVIPALLAIKDKGSTYRYKTTVLYSGKIEDQRLNGDIIIRTEGDPTLGSTLSGVSLEEHMAKIVAGIQKLGIDCIAGDIRMDIPSLFDRPINPTWQWDDLTNYYASGDWGINVNDNEYTLFFNTNGPEGAPAKIQKTDPPIESLSIESEVTIGSSSSGDNSYIYGDPYGNVRVVKGTLPKGSKTFKIKGAIPNPPAYFRSRLLSLLDTEGILVQKTKMPDENRVLVHTILSPTLDRIAKECLHKSINLYSESMANLVTKEHKSESISDVLKNMKVEGADELTIVDGCGLSARNRISPSAFTDFLFKIDDPSANNKLIAQYLPQAGKDGTVATLLQGRNIDAWIKSGYMGGVLSYTGIMKNARGKWVSFSVISNGHSAPYRQVKMAMQDIISEIHRI